MTLHDVRIVHESIDAPPERVYAYVADPRNLPHWAPNFGHTIVPDGDEWVMETADGPYRVRFAPPNDLGVLDHSVRPPAGGEFHNPMRVVANGTGSVITFTLFRQEGWADDRFAEDVRMVAADLAKLKSVLASHAHEFTGEEAHAPQP